MGLLLAEAALSIELLPHLVEQVGFGGLERRFEA